MTVYPGHIIDDSYNTFCKDLDLEKLKKASINLNNVIMDKDSNDSDKKRATFISYQIELKIIFINLINANFNNNFYLKNINYIDNAIIKLEKLGYKNTLDLYIKAKLLLNRINLIFISIEEQFNRLNGYLNKEVLNDILEEIYYITNSLVITDFLVFKEIIIMPDIKGFLEKKIDCLKNIVNERMISICY